MDPQFYTFASNQQTLGVTVHEIDQEFDTGKVLAQASINRCGQASQLAHNRHLFALGIEKLLSYLSGDTQPTQLGSRLCTQNPAVCRYDSWPARQQVKQLTGKGRRLWHWKDICNFAKRPDQLFDLT